MDGREMFASLKKREETFWQMAQAFLDNRDPHGLHDMAVEIEALRRAAKELEKLDG